MDLLRISCAHDLAYVPQYVGIASNYFAELGLDLRLRHGNGTVEDTVGAMERGEADLVLGSCVYGVRLAESGMTPVIVAQSNQQTRHVLAQRTASCADLQRVDLRGKSIVVYPGEAPTAWAAFSYGLTRAGLSLADIKPIIGYTAKDAVDEFIRGVGDLLFIDGEAALRSDLHPALLVCRQTGRLPWSVYMADRTAIGRNEPLFKRFSQGLRSIQRWLRAVDTESIAQAVAPHFSHYSPERLRQVIAFYRSLDLWVGTGDVRSDQLSCWSEALRLGGLVTPDKHLMDYIDVL